MREERETGNNVLSWPLIGEKEKKSSVKEEVKKQLWLSGPLIGVSLLQFCLQVISVMFVGHLGSLPLSAASIATSFASVTGFSFLVSFFTFTLHISHIDFYLSMYLNLLKFDHRKLANSKLIG